MRALLAADLQPMAERLATLPREQARVLDRALLNGFYPPPHGDSGRK